MCYVLDFLQIVCLKNEMQITAISKLKCEQKIKAAKEVRVNMSYKKMCAFKFYSIVVCMRL